MRIFSNRVLGGLGIVGLMLASPASAVVSNIAYNFTTSNSNTTLAASTGLGNSMLFQSQVGNSAVLQMTVTAWNATKATSGVNNGSYVVSKSTLAEYAGGLGVTSKNDDLAVSGCAAAGCGTHQIDNSGNNAYSSSIDFIKLDFNYAVTLGAIQQSAFATYNAGQTRAGDDNDDDFSYGKAASNAVSDGKVITAANFAAIFSTSISNAVTSANGGECTVTTWKPAAVSLTGCNDTRTLTTNANANLTTASKTWYVAASILSNYGGDGQVDAFKLASLTAYYTPPAIRQGAVPEPATWMTMIVGFGTAGVALRRARRQKTATAAA